MPASDNHTKQPALRMVANRETSAMALAREAHEASRLAAAAVADVGKRMTTMEGVLEKVSDALGILGRLEERQVGFVGKLDGAIAADVKHEARLMAIETTLPLLKYVSKLVGVGVIGVLGLLGTTVWNTFIDSKMRAPVVETTRTVTESTTKIAPAAPTPASPVKPE